MRCPPPPGRPTAQGADPPTQLLFLDPQPQNCPNLGSLVPAPKVTRATKPMSARQNSIHSSLVVGIHTKAFFFFFFAVTLYLLRWPSGAPVSFEHWLLARGKAGWRQRLSAARKGITPLCGQPALSVVATSPSVMGGTVGASAGQGHAKGKVGTGGMQGTCGAVSCSGMTLLERQWWGHCPEMPEGHFALRVSRWSKLALPYPPAMLQCRTVRASPLGLPGWSRGVNISLLIQQYSHLISHL